MERKKTQGYLAPDIDQGMPADDDAGTRTNNFIDAADTASKGQDLGKLVPFVVIARSLWLERNKATYAHQRTNTPIAALLSHARDILASLKQKTEESTRGFQQLQVAETALTMAIQRATQNERIGAELTLSRTEISETQINLSADGDNSAETHRSTQPSQNNDSANTEDAETTRNRTTHPRSKESQMQPALTPLEVGLTTPRDNHTSERYNRDQLWSISSDIAHGRPIQRLRHSQNAERHDDNPWTSPPPCFSSSCLRED
ncbi:hypothetical protein R1sor_024176 [Riccia sorocarpa]|uniref:Uncharacterized protein n=1 Tax=Riccia sorocarpa TaxID=122646 RepID=A0ABD3GSZ8_9MARC